MTQGTNQGLGPVQIEIRDVYGRKQAYPANFAAERFAAIAAMKTLTQCTLGNILALGLEIQTISNGVVTGTYKAGGNEFAQARMMLEAA